MKSNFWNEACKYGAIIGGVMSLAYVIEQYLMLSGHFFMMGLVWIAAAVTYIMLLYRLTRRRRDCYSSEEGFSLGQGFGFILTLILASALIKGVVEYFFRSVVIGYAEYIDKLSGQLGLWFENQGVSGALEGQYVAMLRQLQEVSEPSIVATVWSSVFGNALLGLVLGLILAALLVRAPRPFGPQSEE